MFNKSLYLLLDIQPRTTGSKSPPKSHVHDHEYQPLVVDTTTMFQSGVDITTPLEAKSPKHALGQTDPNVEEAFAGLNAPQHPGESSQDYEQQCAPMIHLHNTLAPVFYKQAGAYKARVSEPSANWEPIPIKVETEKSVNLPQQGK